MVTVRVRKRKQSTSFLKKRSKKPLSVSDGTESSRSNSVPMATDESFLLLFFKKEALVSFLLFFLS